MLLNSFHMLSANVIDSLISIKESELTEEERVLLYISLSKEYQTIDQQKSVFYSKRAYDLSGEVGFLQGKADALMQLGDVYAVLGDLKKSIELYKYAGLNYMLLKNNEGIGKAYVNIAKLKNWEGKFDEALQLGFFAVRHLQFSEEVELLARAYNIIGIAYDKSGQIVKAKHYYHKAFNLLYQVNDQYGMANVLNNLAIISGKEEKYDESLNLFNQSLVLNNHPQNIGLQTKLLNNIGNIYKIKGQFTDAEIYFREAVDINLKSNNTRSLMVSYLNLASLFQETNHIMNAFHYLNRACEIAEDMQTFPEMAECYLKYSEMYEKQGDYKKALDFHRKFKEIFDSLQNETMALNIQKSEEQFLSKSNRNELLLERKDNEILKLKLEKSIWMKNFILGVLIAVVVFLIMFLLQYRSKHKSNEYLEQINKELSLANSRLIESETKMKEWNATRDKFFSIISHDLRNPIASMVSFIRIMNRDYDSMSREEIIQLISDMKLSIEKAQDLLENLLIWTKSQTGKIPFNPEHFNFYDAVQDNVHLFQSLLSQKQISLSVFVENPANIYGDFNMIKTVLRNLLSNAVKFTKHKGNIKICFEKNEKHFVFKVIDDGLGMTQEEISLLFTPGGQRSKRGTADEKGTGIGLLICREFVERHKGNIDISSSPGKGSTFAVSVPLET